MCCLATTASHMECSRPIWNNLVTPWLLLFMSSNHLSLFCEVRLTHLHVQVYKITRSKHENVHVPYVYSLMPPPPIVYTPLLMVVGVYSIGQSKYEMDHCIYIISRNGIFGCEVDCTSDRMIGWLLVTVRVQLHACDFQVKTLTCVGLTWDCHTPTCRCNNELK